MAHTFGQNSTHTSAATSPITVAFTTLPGETVLVVMLKVVGATDRAGGALTFGDATLTQASTTQKAAASPECSAELWYLENPPIGAFTLTIPNTGSLTIFHMIATGKATPGGRSKFDVATGANNTSTNPTASVTTTEDGAMLFSVVATGAQTWAPSAQDGTALNNTDDGATGTGRQYFLQSTLGAKAMGWTFATSDDWGVVVAAFREVRPPKLENYFGVKCASAGVISVNERIR